MRKLEASDFKCVLSGWPISPGEFELDHIVSINDGGSDETDNLQCVHPLVNKAKGTMSNEQFIELCHRVAQNTPPRTAFGSL